MFFVTRVFFNAEEAQQSSIQKFDDREQAFKRYYSILASDIDKDEYSYEMVQIVRDDGVCVASQVFDRRTTEQDDGSSIAAQVFGDGTAEHEEG